MGVMVQVNTFSCST